MRLAALRRGGLRLSMRLERGTRVVQVRVLRRGAVVATVVRVPPCSGPYAVTLRDRAIRRLGRGRYVVEVRAGASPRALGTAARRALTVG